MLRLCQPTDVASSKVQPRPAHLTALVVVGRSHSNDRSHGQGAQQLLVLAVQAVVGAASEGDTVCENVQIRVAAAGHGKDKRMQEAQGVGCKDLLQGADVRSKSAACR